MSTASLANEADGAIAIAATFTAEPLEEALCFWLKTLQLPLSVRFAPYHQVFQELLSPQSVLATNRSGINVLLVRLEDFARDQQKTDAAHDSSELARRLTQTARELLDAVQGFVQHSTLPLLISLLPVSPEVEARLGTSLAETKADLKRALQSLAKVVLVDPQEVALYSPRVAFDPVQDELGHVPYTGQYFAALASALARRVHALRVPSRKVLVLDCDNTLWRGVVGEDGRDGIVLGDGALALQQFAKEQFLTGTLVCLCSKNAEADVIDVFDKRPDMQLKLEHIVAHRINWNPKVQNLIELAEELNLGLSSFVFVDDNPVELAEVRAALPQVLALETPSDQDMPGFLKNLWAFDRIAITDVDSRRTQLYRENVARNRFERDTGSIGAFIAGLGLQIDIGPVADTDWARVAQLTQRTNQFNFTTIRRNEPEMRALLDAGKQILTVQVRDRFGDYGLVAVVVLDAADDQLIVDTMLLSCRVLGRGVEHAIVRHLGQIAAQRGLGFVSFEYRPTAKNEPARAFIESIAGAYRQPGEQGDVYRIPRAVAESVEHRPGADPKAVLDAARSDRVDPVAKIVVDCAPAYDLIARSLQHAEAVHGAVLKSRLRQQRASSAAEHGLTDTERRLLTIWEEQLGIDGITSEDDFFDLGGTSLAAVALFSKIANEFDVRLPLTTILEAPTVRALAARITMPSEAFDSGEILELRGGGPTKFFFVHDGDGETIPYRSLSRILPANIAAFGLAPKQVKGIPLAHTTVEAMAEHYVGQIRRAQPQGPYLVGGLCAGGTIAFEVARQLEAIGETVALLVLFDAASPIARRKQGVVASRRLSRARELLHSGSGSSKPLRLVAQAARRARNIMRYELGKYGKGLADSARYRLMREILDRGQTWPEWLPALTVRSIVERAERQYVPGALHDTSVVLFRALGCAGPGSTPFRELFEDECFGWSNHVHGEFECVDVPGNHSTMLQQPHVEVLLKELLRFLPAPFADSSNGPGPDSSNGPNSSNGPVSNAGGPASDSAPLSSEELLRTG